MQRAVCGVCGRDVLLQPGEARSCPSCGNIVSAPAMVLTEDETQRLVGSPNTGQEDGTTRPIDPAALPPPPAATATLPQASGQGRATSVSTGDAPPRWSADPTTQALPQDYVPPPPPANVLQHGAAKGRKRSRAPLVLSVLALVLLLAFVSVVGVLASAHTLPFIDTAPLPTATAAHVLIPTATAPPGYAVYRDIQGVYQVCRPTAWSVEEQGAFGGTGVALVKPNSSVGMAIIQLPVSDSPTNQALVATQLAQLAQQGTVSNQQRLADRMIGATSWSQGSADWLPGQQGASTEHIVVLATVRDGRSFVIELLESPGATNSADEAIFETMLACFTFL
jgi:hypothetical protein